MDIQITIRPLEEGEFTTFVNFRSEALLNTPEEYGSDYESFNALSMLDKEQLFEKLLNYPLNFVFGAFSAENELVGIAGFSVKFEKPKQRHKGYLWGVYVSPVYRKKGIASRLIEDILNVAQEDAGCEQVLVNVASTNTEGQNLYRKLGFLQYGTELRAFKLKDGTYIDEHMMVRMF